MELQQKLLLLYPLLRATGHDFTEIGTGGFNTSNYPNVLLGSAVGGLEAKAGPYTDADNATSSKFGKEEKVEFSLLVLITTASMLVSILL